MSNLLLCFCISLIGRKRSAEVAGITSEGGMKEMRKEETTTVSQSTKDDQSKATKNNRDIEYDEMSVEELKKQLQSLQAEQTMLRKGE